MSTNPIERIETAGYNLDSVELNALGETFAGVSAISADIGTTLLRVLVTALGSDLAHKTGIPDSCIDDHWRAIAGPFEAGFRRANPDMPAREINRRLTFLRSIKSTVKAWRAAGGDPVNCVREGHHKTVTKSSLTASTQVLRGPVPRRDEVQLFTATTAECVGTAVRDLFKALRAMGDTPERAEAVRIIQSELATFGVS